MTDREQHSENRDCGADAAAYVLGALEPGEVEAFRAHMATCVVCRDEVSAARAFHDPPGVPGPYTIANYRARFTTVATNKAPFNGTKPFGKDGAALGY